MEGVTISDLDRKIDTMNREGMDVSLDLAYGGHAVCNKSGNRKLSPRMSKRGCMDWLRAYEEGWRDHARNGGRGAEVGNIQPVVAQGAG